MLSTYIRTNFAEFPLCTDCLRITHITMSLRCKQNISTSRGSDKIAKNSRAVCFKRVW